MKLSVTFTVEDDTILVLLDSASRGTNYWCENKLAYESEAKIALFGCGANVYDIEGEKEYLLNGEQIHNGLIVMAEEHTNHFWDILTGNFDQTTGDVFLQCCLFDEVKYS